MRFTSGIATWAGSLLVVAASRTVILARCDREALAGVLRSGNAGANNAADHVTRS